MRPALVAVGSLDVGATAGLGEVVATQVEPATQRLKGGFGGFGACAFAAKLESATLTEPNT